MRSVAPQIAVGLLAIVRVLPDHSAAQRKQLESAEKLLVECCFPSEVRDRSVTSLVCALCRACSPVDSCRRLTQEKIPFVGDCCRGSIELAACLSAAPPDMTLAHGAMERAPLLWVIVKMPSLMKGTYRSQHGLWYCARYEASTSLKPEAMSCGTTSYLATHRVNMCLKSTHFPDIASERHLHPEKEFHMRLEVRQNCQVPLGHMFFACGEALLCPASSTPIVSPAFTVGRSQNT